MLQGAIRRPDIGDGDGACLGYELWFGPRGGVRGYSFWLHAAGVQNELSGVVAHGHIAYRTAGLTDPARWRASWPPNTQLFGPSLWTSVWTGTQLLATTATVARLPTETIGGARLAPARRTRSWRLRRDREDGRAITRVRGGVEPGAALELAWLGERWLGGAEFDAKDGRRLWTHRVVATATAGWTCP